MFNFTILFQDAEVACAEADTFPAARMEAINEAKQGFYADVLRDCEFSAVSDSGVVRTITGPLFLS